VWGEGQGVHGTMLKQMLTNPDGGLRPAVSYSLMAAAVLLGGYFIYRAVARIDSSPDVAMMCMTSGCDYTR